MDQYHFGNSESAVILVDILKRPQNILFQRKVVAIMCEYHRVMREISDSNLRDQLKRAFLTATFKKFRTKFERFEGELQTFSWNVLSQTHRKYLNSIS